MSDVDNRSDELKRSIQEELKRAIRSVGVLLEFLGRAPDQQLKVQFDGVKAGKTLNITPPCHSYADFLNRLMSIRISYLDNGAVDGENLKGDPPLSDRSFISWSQDFLAAMAAPATVESIQLTESFLTYRFNGNVAVPSTSPPPSSDDRFAMYAKDMVNKINRQYWITLGVTFVTIFISIYALSGHQIIDQRKTAVAELASINTKIADLEAHLPNPVIVKRSAIDYVKSVEQSQAHISPDAQVALAPAAETEPPAATVTSFGPIAKTSPTKTVLQPDGKFYLCDNVEVVKDDQAPKEEKPSFGPYQNDSIYYYGTYDGIDVCNQRSNGMLKVFAIGEQLISWERLSTLPLTMLTRWDSVPDEFSQNTPLCEAYAGFDSKASDPKTCALYISEISEYFGSTAESILGCISLYILPCLYGFLGASVATFRYLRRQVDKSYLNFTDRSVFIQNGILGVVAGIVVGLFVSSFSSGTGTATALGLSAIAFLSGYNVSGLFAFFDEVSGRIFRADGQPAK